MRSFWCTLIAVCLMAAGVRPTAAARTHDVAASMHATSASVPPVAQRLPPRHELGAYVPPATPVLGAPRPPAIAIADVAPVALPASTVPAAHLARGPPRG